MFILVVYEKFFDFFLKLVLRFIGILGVLGGFVGVGVISVVIVDVG